MLLTADVDWARAAPAARNKASIRLIPNTNAADPRRIFWVELRFFMELGFCKMICTCTNVLNCSVLYKGRFRAHSHIAATVQASLAVALSQRCYGLSELTISLPLIITQISVRSLSPDAAYVNVRPSLCSKSSNQLTQQSLHNNRIRNLRSGSEVHGEQTPAMHTR